LGAGERELAYRMSSKPAIIRQRDVTRIVKGAAAAGITMGIVVAGDEVRFVPVDEMAPANAPSALERFKAARNASKARGNS
jgi:hypothetical protein